MSWTCNTAWVTLGLECLPGLPPEGWYEDGVDYTVHACLSGLACELHTVAVKTWLQIL